MYETVPAYILFIWLSAHGGNYTVHSTPFWTKAACDNAALLAAKTAASAYCIKAH